LIISDAFHNDRIRVMTDIRSCELNIELALPLGLIVNELLTNSFKYAFPGNRKGTIEVSLIPEEGDRWALMIRDDGVGLKDGFASEASHSMGSQIVQILVEQIEAEFSVTGNGGTCFVVRFAALLETN
jgi:two-component sensor histidine kinase